MGACSDKMKIAGLYPCNIPLPLTLKGANGDLSIVMN